MSYRVLRTITVDQPRQNGELHHAGRSVPAFRSGYPYISKLEDVSAQYGNVTKSCRLYYTLLTKGTLPHTAELTSEK